MVIYDCLPVVRLNKGANRPPFFGKVFIPQKLIKLSQHLLWKKGKRSLEELLLWSGWALDHAAVITTIIKPESCSSPNFVEIRNPLKIAVIGDFEAERGQLVMAQVHSHPDSFVIPSYDDLTLSFCMLPGFLHIIAPHYGRDLELGKCGIYETKGQNRFGAILRRIPRSEIMERFRIVRPEELEEVLACRTY